MARLFQLPYSPWSEKARWALDHHRVPYERVDHVPLLGDLRLRVLQRKPTGRVTVPALEDSGTWYTDSLEIARRAEAVGSGSPLFPRGLEAEVLGWNRLSEEAMTAGRAVMLLGQADDPQTALDALPPGVPAGLKPLLAPLARKGMEAFIAKYRMRDAAASHPRVFEAGL
ncbi:MAG TPA: glutathione S-transferase, partial [Candidatus Nanopelagicales bacterium]|nr:glutathione S-transferase [Candidatus Nanopelagicales bacterium]